MQFDEEDIGVEFQRRHEAIMLLSIERAQPLWKYMSLEVSPNEGLAIVAEAMRAHQQIQNGSGIFAEPNSDYSNLQAILKQLAVNLTAACGQVIAHVIEKWICETYKTVGETRVEYAWRMALASLGTGSGLGGSVAISQLKQNRLLETIRSKISLPQYQEDLDCALRQTPSVWESVLRAELDGIDPFDFVIGCLDLVQFQELWAEILGMLDEAELTTLLHWYRAYYNAQRYMPMELPPLVENR